MRLSVKQNTQEKSERGFILIEAIVSITLLVMTVGAVMGATTLSFEGYRTAQKNYTAAKIAQEGIELVVNKRDNHSHCVSSNEDCPIEQWHQNLRGTWQVDATKPEQLLPENTFDTYDSDHVLCKVTDPEKDIGKFGYCDEVTGEVIRGNYNRKVEVSNIPGGGGGLNKVRVESTVTWDEDKSYTLEEVLFGS